jgi:hypothetical protein
VVSFDADRIMIGDKEGAFNRLRETMKQKGVELYLISDIMGYWDTPDSESFDIPHTIRCMDAFSSAGCWNFSNEYARTHFLEFLDHLYGRWYVSAKNLGKDLVPVTMPGNEIPDVIRQRFNPGFIDLPYDPNRMRQLFLLGTKYSHIQKIVSFNAWGAHQIEPTLEYGFAYLDVVKKYVESFGS